MTSGVGWCFLVREFFFVSRFTEAPWDCYLSLHQMSSGTAGHRPSLMETKWGLHFIPA